MVCKLDRPSPQVLYDRIAANFSANVLGGFDIIPESLEAYVVANDYAAAEAFYSVAEAQWKARDPRYACCDDLYAMAARDGVYPNAAGFSQGYVRLTGATGAAIPNPLEVVIDSQHYVAVGTVATTMPSNGHLDIRVKAVVPGTDGNVALRNTTGSLASSATGIDNEVKPFGTTFCGGSNAEACEVFRDRYIERLAYKPVANSAWLIAKMLEWPCVTRVLPRSGSCCRIIHKEGCGCAACGCNSCTQDLNFYPLFDDTFDCGIPPDCVIDDMQSWLFGTPAGRGLGQAPVGICGQLYAPEAALVDVRISGIQCSTASQVSQMRNRIADVFRLAAPSELFTIRTVELAIAQVVGTSNAFNVVFDVRTNEQHIGVTSCGDLNPACDYMVCLNDVLIIGSDITEGGC